MEISEAAVLAVLWTFSDNSLDLFEAYWTRWSTLYWRTGADRPLSTLRDTELSHNGYLEISTMKLSTLKICTIATGLIMAGHGIADEKLDQRIAHA